MAIKEITAYVNHSTEDFGLPNTGTRTHIPQFFLLRKWPVDESADSSRHFHPYSSEASLAAAVELEDKDMERWTSSSAEEGIAAEVTPETEEVRMQKGLPGMGSLTKKKRLINPTVLGV